MAACCKLCKLQNTFISKAEEQCHLPHRIAMRIKASYVNKSSGILFGTWWVLNEC